MDTVYRLAGYFLAFSEAFIVFTVSGNMCGKRHSRGKYISLVLISSFVYAVLIAFLNSTPGIPFVVTVVAIAFSVLINYIVSEGNFALRAASLTMIWFFLHAMDYIFSYSLVFVFDKAADSFEKLASSDDIGFYQIILRLIDRLVRILIVCLLRNIYPKFRQLKKSYLITIFLISLCSYVIMLLLSGVIISESVIAVQLAVVLSVFFVALSLTSTVFAVSISTRYEEEKRETELMNMTNVIMEKNYLEMQNYYDATHQQVHDFKNHLKTIMGMLDTGNQAKEYIEQLLDVSYKQAKYCNCGDNVVDSIINCKINEAQTQNVPFGYKISLYGELNISSVDICAILANQIDNAIEACVKKAPDTERFVNVEIWQKEYFVFFKVTNTCSGNPFNRNNKLISSKTDSIGLHGYGIKNITKTAEKYGGMVKNNYDDGVFVSVVMLPNNK